MNLNFHLVDISADFTKPQAMDRDAQAAVAKARLTAADVRALVELLDWEGANRSPLGQRCAEVLKQQARQDSVRAKLLNLAKASPAAKAALTSATPVVALAA